MAGMAFAFSPATSPFFDMFRYCVAALLIAVFVAESSSVPDAQVCACKRLRARKQGYYQNSNMERMART